jgi:hypothetical protein
VRRGIRCFRTAFGVTTAPVCAASGGTTCEPRDSHGSPPKRISCDEGTTFCTPTGVATANPEQQKFRDSDEACGASASKFVFVGEWKTQGSQAEESRRNSPKSPPFSYRIRHSHKTTDSHSSVSPFTATESQVAQHSSNRLHTLIDVTPNLHIYVMLSIYVVVTKGLQRGF